MQERITRSGHPERRDQTPPGRLRRIFFEYRWATLGLAVAAVVAAVLFVAATSWALEARLERRVTEIAYTHDARAMEFLRARAARAEAELEGRVAALEEREEELLPEGRPYLTVSIAERRVWYVSDEDTVFSAPVAVGSGETLVIGGETKRFQTPRGRMTITHKERDPVWVPPTWHYVEYARNRGLRVVDLSSASPNALAGFPPGRVPVRNGVVYVPPWGSPQRKHRGVLGVAKLEMQDGYYFHGTENEASVGSAASHGCLRMRRDDILWMYEHVPVGTPVYIY